MDFPGPLFILPMLLIADSGSTKTDWRLVDNNSKIHQLKTQGFNPFFQDSEDISSILKNEFFHQLPSGIDLGGVDIYFYGAGCSSEIKCAVVQEGLKKVFPEANVEVNHDLLAAARATCGTNPGLAAILGTGSNSCWYDGKNIVENIPALGFILGDEGSGAHMGKTFIKDYLNKEVPEHIAQRFITRFKLSKEDILDAVYKKPFPNRFLAGFSKFIYQNLKDQYISDLVTLCLNQFFDKHICKYQPNNQLKLNVVGSVGFYFSNYLTRIALERGLETDKIIESPIAGLTLYHLGEFDSKQ
ncbi:MAG: N-acetylglucosamine kinase [Bacteroidetes bacterium]|nr:N-acetylglucosamine kinase [Bacteroidota bacterium]HET6244245.1 N-acetylglucosamine kinase [Bacteroidia bacterium]